MLHEAVEAGFYESNAWGKFPRIQILTIEELLASKAIDYPRGAADATFKRDPRRQIRLRQYEPAAGLRRTRVVRGETPMLQLVILPVIALLITAGGTVLAAVWRADKAKLKLRNWTTGLTCTGVLVGTTICLFNFRQQAHEKQQHEAEGREQAGRIAQLSDQLSVQAQDIQARQATVEQLTRLCVPASKQKRADSIHSTLGRGAHESAGASDKATVRRVPGAPRN